MTSYNTTESPESRIERFHANAAAYCQFIDRFGNEEIPHLYSTLAELLADLAMNAHKLPNRSPDNDPPKIQSPSYDEINKKIRSVLTAVMPGVIQYYSEYYKDNMDALATATMIDDDLADIYLDLKDGLNHYACGDPDNIAKAVWCWKWSFEEHWGFHLFQAMKTTHLIRFQLCNE